MNALNAVYIENGQVLTDTFAVARIFNKAHADVMRDVRRILSEIDMEWGIRAFAETPYTHPQNGQTYVMYAMTEDGFTLLAMGYTGREAMQFKVQYIQEFRRMKEELERPKVNLPANYIEALKALVVAEEEKAAQAAQLAAQQPKVALYDVAMTAENAMAIGTAAKLLNIGPNKLFAWLREQGLLMTQGSRYNLPRQTYIDQGLFTVREYTITHTSHIENKTQTLVTQKGLAYIHERWQAAHQTGLEVAK